MQWIEKHKSPQPTSKPRFLVGKVKIVGVFFHVPVLKTQWITDCTCAGAVVATYQEMFVHKVPWACPPPNKNVLLHTTKLHRARIRQKEKQLWNLALFLQLRSSPSNKFTWPCSNSVLTFSIAAKHFDAEGGIFLRKKKSSLKTFSHLNLRDFLTRYRRAARQLTTRHCKHWPI